MWAFSLLLSQHIELIRQTNRRSHCHTSPQTALRAKKYHDYWAAVCSRLWLACHIWVLKKQNFKGPEMHIQWQTSNTTPLSVRQGVELGVTVTGQCIKLFWKFLNKMWYITMFISSEGCNVTYNRISSLEDTKVQMRFRLQSCDFFVVPFWMTCKLLYWLKMYLVLSWIATCEHLSDKSVFFLFYDLLFWNAFRPE